jgi:hypothetical protein
MAVDKEAYSVLEFLNLNTNHKRIKQMMFQVEPRSPKIRHTCKTESFIKVMCVCNKQIHEIYLLRTQNCVATDPYDVKCTVLEPQY